MECKKIDLYDYFGIEKPDGAEASLEYCLHAASDYYPDRIRPAMVVGRRRRLWWYLRERG